MNTSGRKRTSSDREIARALREYQDRLARGESINADQFLSDHPQIAAELRPLLNLADDASKKSGDADESGTVLASHDTPKAARETARPSSNDESRSEFPAVGSITVPGVFGRYRIERTLGEGAMGSVYLAQDTVLQRAVALKIPKFTSGDSPEMIERFYQEARSAATINHPHVCSVYDIGEHSGIRFISMEYVDGKLLSEYIRPDRPQPDAQVAAMIRKIAIGLQAAHECGVVHRDLKPANVMVDRKHEPVVMDFGLARQFSAGQDHLITQSGTLIGSPAYMSPEQVDGDLEIVGPPTDVYSLGVILYEMLTARLPFEGSLAAVIGRIVTQEPLPPTEIQITVDPRLEAICLKMMSKQIARRYPTMRAAADALGKYLREAKRHPHVPIAIAEPVDSTEPVEPSSGTLDGSLRIDAFEEQKQEILGLIEAGELNSAAKRLEHIPKLGDSAAGNYRSWAKGQLAKVNERRNKIRRESGAALRTARRLVEMHDYRQAVELLERIPTDCRNAALTELLEEATELQDEVEILAADLDDAVSQQQFEGLLPNVERLLELKPGHRKARELYGQLIRERQRETSGISRVGAMLGMRNADPAAICAVLSVFVVVFTATLGYLVYYLGTSRAIADVNTVVGDDEVDSPPPDNDPDSPVQPGEQDSPDETTDAKNISTAAWASRKFPPGQWVSVLETADEVSVKTGCTLTDGEVHLKRLRNGRIRKLERAIRGTRGHDMIVRAKVHKVSDGGHLYMTVRGNYHATFNGWKRFAIDGRRRDRMGKKSERAVLDVKKTRQNHYGKSVEWSLAVVGNELTTYVNRQLINKVSDSLLSKEGHAGIGVFNCHGQFKDVEVMLLDGLTESEKAARIRELTAPGS